jgi:hypothetical protein
MPSQINNMGNVVNVTANYLVTKPSTKFSTRDLAFMVIDADNSNYYNNFEEPDSTFSRTVRTVQTQAEIYAVGTPDSGYVTIVVAIDTASDGSNTDGFLNSGGNAMAKRIRNALLDAGLNADSVSFKRLYGNGFTGQDMNGYNPDGQTYVD